MNPKQFGLMLGLGPALGRIVLVARKPTSTFAIRDLTEDFVLMHAAEIMREVGPDAQGSALHTTYEVRHPNGDVLEIEFTAKITNQRRGNP